MDLLAAISEPGPPEPKLPESKSLSNEETFKLRFNQLHSSYMSVVIPIVQDNRDARVMTVDSEALKAEGKLLPHEIFVAQRIIDTNISRALPDHISYLTQSRRLVLFQAINKHTAQDVTELETEFHRVLTYENWIIDYIRYADSTNLHGWGFVDVGYDESKPGHVSVEFIQNGHLFFDLRVKDIQQSPLVARVYEITQIDLYNLAEEYGFDPAVVAELNEQLDDVKDGNNQPDIELTRIYRVFYKEKGQVFAGWYTKHIDKFLVKPAPFWNGVSTQVEELPVPAPGQLAISTEPIVRWEPATETEYPFHFYLNRVSEDENIVHTPGRGILDFYTQEAACGLWSSIINRTTEASNVMWCPENANLEAPTAPKQLEFSIEHGKIWNQPMRAFSPPYPDATLPNVLDILRTQNAEDTNQISFATNNRKDTRKTATEIEAAQMQDSVMGTVTVTNWATALSSVWNAAWRIIQSEALQGNIAFCALPDGPNNVELVGQDYKLIPAGTTDYVERMEVIASMQSDIPIVLPTAAGPAFLEEYLKLKYPNNAEKFITPLRQQQAQSQQTTQALQTLLQEAVTDEAGNLMPEWQPHAMELQQLGIKAGPALQQPLTPAQNEEPIQSPAA